MTSSETIDLELGWKRIEQEAIDVLIEILESGIGSTSKSFSREKYMTIYTTCYNMCTQRAPYNFSEQLYQRHGQAIEDYLSMRVLPALRAKTGNEFLNEVVFRWNNHEIMNKWMHRFFVYLDRHFVKHHALPPLLTAGMEKFRSTVYSQVHESVVEEIARELNAARAGEEIDDARIQACAHMFTTMGPKAFHTGLIEPLLQASHALFAERAATWLDEHSPAAYFVVAEKALDAERDRVRMLFGDAPVPAFIGAFNAEVLERPQASLIDRPQGGIAAMLDNDRVEDVRRVFRLYADLGGCLEAIGNKFRDFAAKSGMAVVNEREVALRTEKESATDHPFIQKLLRVNAKLREMVQEWFFSHKVFLAALKNGCEAFMNKESGARTNAELLAAYADRLLRKGGERVNQDEMEKTLEDVERLFGYISSKDVFAEHYRHHLARRLLNGRSKSDDAERKFIGKLKLRCGPQFAAKLEGMMGDFSADRQESGRAMTLDGEVEFKASILTQGYWPTYQPLSPTLPVAMERCISMFSTKYQSTSSRKKLAWAYSLGTATITARLGRVHTLQATSAQAIVLLLMADGKKRSVAEIVEATGMPSAAVKHLLHSLACSKYRVLKKQPAGKSVKSTDEFTANTSFTCPLRLVKLPQATLEGSRTSTKVSVDRTRAIEACIVRVMKSRKRMAHSPLVTEVLSQLRTFQPEARVIKRCIESLVEREYLERDEDNPGMYAYVA